MNTPEIRPYRVTDRAGLVSLWRAVFADDPPHNEPGAVIDAKLELADDLLLVAVDGEGLVGSVMAGYDGHRGWLYAVAVDPRRRRRGLGRRLVEAALARLGERGCVKVNLQVRSGNDAVVGFYRELGFDVEPRISLGKLLTESSNGAENP